MKLRYCTIPPRLILLLMLFTILARFPSCYAVLRISARITEGSDVSISDVDGILSVPSNAELILNCSSTVGNMPDWSSTASQSPLLTASPRFSLAQISRFSQINTGEYTCLGEGTEKKISVNLDELAILPNPEQYHVYESEGVTLSACVSAYPSLKSNLIIRWSRQGADLSSCNSQGIVGCLECPITATNFSAVLNFSFEATTQGRRFTQFLIVTVHRTPAVVGPLPPSTSVIECRALALMCIGTGDPTLSVEWRHTPANSHSVVLSNQGSYSIHTETMLSPEDGQHYTTSTLTIRPAGLDAAGEYTCSFVGYGGRSRSTGITLYVHPQLCLQRMITAERYDPVPGSSVQVLDTSQGTEVFICNGDGASWYQDDAPVPYDGNVYQGVVFGGLFIAQLSEPSYFYCGSATSSLQTWIYATTSNPAVITRPSGTLYRLAGQNVSIHAYLSPPGGEYTLDWFYIVSGVKRNVTEFDWSINQLSQEINGYYEVSIDLFSFQVSHSGVIRAEYSVGGQVASTQLSLAPLPPPELVLSPNRTLTLWEGSSLEVSCLLRNESVPVSVPPHWTAVPSCTPQTEVCAEDQTLRLNNATLSEIRTYVCAAENEAGRVNASLQVAVSPLSPQLLLFTVRTQDRTINVDSAVYPLNLSSSQGPLLLSCSPDNSSARYLNASSSWSYDASYSHAVSTNGSYLRVDTQAVLSQQSAFNASFCCLAQLGETRRTQKCLAVTFGMAPTTTPTVPSTATTDIVLFLSVDNCSLFPSMELLEPIRLALLGATRARCGCSISDNELILSRLTCHKDLVINSPEHLLTLCGSSTYLLYTILISEALARLNVSLANSSMVITSVSDFHVGTHCNTITTTSPIATTSLIVELPVWSRVLLFGAFPLLLLLLIIVLILILVYISYNILYRTGNKKKSFSVTDEAHEMTELPDPQQALEESNRYLISSQATLSPSRVPQTFKTSSYPTYPPESPPPQELLSRPASSPTNQGEFPVMYSNPLAFDGSGELYSSFTNFNNNRNYSSDMPLETAGSLTTHRVSLQWPASAASLAGRAVIRRDPAHSSLPSPLRSARRYAAQRRLYQQRSRAYPPCLHHQLKIRHPPPPPPPSAKISRYETPTLDSGVSEMESIHPRSSSASSYSEVSDDPPPRARASSLATSFPQHLALRARSHSTNWERNASLPNILNPSATKSTSQGTNLALYRTVQNEDQGSQTLV